jgi:DNA mismatch endonuclease (patch repair protein)
MAAIRSRNTRAELTLRAELRRRGLVGYRCNHKTLPGKPDIAYTRWRLAVFIDGAFWHGHPDHFRVGALGEYWDAKIARTQERDRLQQTALEKSGWTVLRFWDFQVKSDAASCANAVGKALQKAGYE